MSAASTSFKLGIFTILTIAAVALVALVLGVRGIPKETVEYHTYFDESVVGLDIGAPVKLRGIAVGTVTRIAFASTGELVDVAFAVDAGASHRLAWAPAPARDTGLRAQLASQGITGVKLIDLDVVDPEVHPPPALPFAAPPHYVPATRSLLTRIGDGLGKTVDRFPEIVDTAVAALGRLEAILERLDERGVPDTVGTTVENMNLAVSELRGIMRRLDKGGAAGKSAATLDRLDAAIEAFGRVMARIDGDGGLVASTQRATEAVGQLGRSAAGTTDELDRTVRDVGEAARAIRSIADALERNPDMLVKGRRNARSP